MAQLCTSEHDESEFCCPERADICVPDCCTTVQIRAAGQKQSWEKLSWRIENGGAFGYTSHPFTPSGNCHVTRSPLRVVGVMDTIVTHDVACKHDRSEMQFAAQDGPMCVCTSLLPHRHTVLMTGVAYLYRWHHDAFSHTMPRDEPHNHAWAPLHVIVACQTHGSHDTRCYTGSTTSCYTGSTTTPSAAARHAMSHTP